MTSLLFDRFVYTYTQCSLISVLITWPITAWMWAVLLLFPHVSGAQGGQLSGGPGDHRSAVWKCTSHFYITIQYIQLLSLTIVCSLRLQNACLMVACAVHIGTYCLNCDALCCLWSCNVVGLCRYGCAWDIRYDIDKKPWHWQWCVFQRAQPEELDRIRNHYKISDEEQLKLLDKPEQSV